MPIRLSSEDVARFANWSADCNPLHVDDAFARQTHFGGRIAHGMLTVLEAFRETTSPADAVPTSLEIEFRGAVVPGGSYDTRCEREGYLQTVTLEADGQALLVARGVYGPRMSPAPFESPAWMPAARTHLPRTAPAAPALDAFERGLEIAGAYPAPGSDFLSSGLSAQQARILALCSYIVGMEAPGLKSLFTRVEVTFHDADGAASDLFYRARTVRFDRVFRLLDTEVEIVSTSGAPVASASVRGYVPFSPADVDPVQLAALVADDDRALQDRVALVLGGSRGLGAEVATSLALAGCHVYVSARQDDDARQDLHRTLAAQGCAITFLQGDASDTNWCETTLDTIRARHGRLDVLVLNACARPFPLRLGRASAAAQAAYVTDNLRLVETPLAVFAGLVDESGGTLAYVSSSYVEAPPAGFAHYVAVKTAGEAMVRTACREAARTSAIVMRPPELQTRWNDTPAAVHGAIPSHRVAVRLVRLLAGDGRAAGSVDVVTEFPAVEAPALEAPPDYSLRLVASFTTDPLLPALHFWMKELGLNAAVESAAYGQVLQSLLDPSSAFNAKGRGFNVVGLRVSDWLREIAEEQSADADGAAAHLERTARDFEGAIRAHRQQASAETLLLLCPSDPTLDGGIAERVAETEAHLRAALQGIGGLDVVTAADYHAAYRVSEQAMHDGLRDEIGHIPFVDEYFFTLATIAARHAYRRIAPIRKVVAVDCDNTLWRGVVGEVGAEGSRFDEGHRALHRTLARLAQSGVLVCLCSKNEEPDVWRVFETRQDLLAAPRAGRGRDGQLAAEVAEPQDAGRAAQPRARQLRVHRRQPGRMRRGAGRLPGGPHDPVAAGPG